MFRKSVIGSIAAMVAIACTDVTRVEARQTECGIGTVEFVQITSMWLDAGKQTFEAFRILRSGKVEWARWNSSGHLLDHAKPFDTDSETFNKAVSSPSFLNPPKLHQDAGVLGRPAFRLDMAIILKSGIKAISMTKMPDDIANLIDVIRRGIKAISVQSGWYVWTQPYPQISKADIEIANAMCDSAVATALSEAITTGRLIVKADDSIQSFIKGERANRIFFEARLPTVNLIFGVISAK